MTTPEETPSFSIGAVFGDYNPENNAWDSVITETMRQVKSLRHGVKSPLKVNVVFHVDGKLAPNEFSGVRTGRFSKKDSHLMVQAAIPLGPVEDKRKELLRLLSDAIDEAELFAQKRKISLELAEIRGILSKL